MAAFILWTALVMHCDVRPIGPKGTTVGLAGINEAFHNLTGVHMMIYTITDWLGLVPLFYWALPCWDWCSWSKEEAC